MTSTVAEEFEHHRPYLTGVAYRMLGSLADAEDAVQDAWLRLARTDRSHLDDLRAWLTTVTARLCLDRLRSVRAARETYVGPWLPEPLVEHLAADGSDPAEAAVSDESVRMALLLVLERLTPEQRIAFVLHDVFAVPFHEVGAALGVSTEAARQLASRARRAVRDRAPRRTAPPAEQQAVLAGFLVACQRGDLDGLLRILAPDVVLRSDGGGAVRAALRPVEGADRVASFLIGIVGMVDVADLDVRVVRVNGQAGVAARPRSGGEPGPAVATIDVAPDGRVERVWIVRNPAKLTRSFG